MKILILFLFFISLFTFTLEQKKTCEQENATCMKRCVKEGGAQRNMCEGICRGMFKRCKKIKK